MQTVKVNLKQNQSRSYKIIARFNIVKTLHTWLTNKTTSRFAVISDNNVASLYGQKIVRQLRQHGIRTDLFTFKSGEKSKNFKVAETLLNSLIKRGYTRQDHIIALGGGVTGDIAGFIASIYMRGISLIQVPTSLLAMVDSSIGGKNGINLKFGKNLAGTFYQPTIVIIDPAFLKTLPQKEFSNGFAEIIKYGIIADYRLFRLLEKKQPINLLPDKETMNKIIIHCASIKAKITEKDEQEKKQRIILNYGHTTGHAIEVLSKYKINHGHAIALGMVIANNIGIITDILKENEAKRIKNLLINYKLPTSPTHFFPKKQSQIKLWQIMQGDKKMQNNNINFVIPNKIGSTTIFNMVNQTIFLKAFNKND